MARVSAGWNVWLANRSSRNVVTRERRLAGSTGLEPAASAVTGQRSNQLNYDPRFAGLQSEKWTARTATRHVTLKPDCSAIVPSDPGRRIRVLVTSSLLGSSLLGLFSLGPLRSRTAHCSSCQIASTKPRFLPSSSTPSKILAGFSLVGGDIIVRNAFPTGLGMPNAPATVFTRYRSSSGI